MALESKSWVKRQYDRLRYLFAAQGSAYIISSTSGVPAPFNYMAALRQYRSWVYAAATINARAVAAVPLKLYERGGGKRVDRHRRAYLRGETGVRPSLSVLRKTAEWGNDWTEVQSETPITKLLSRPNPHENAFAFHQGRFLQLELTGNSYLHVVCDRLHGFPRELWLLRSDLTRVLPGRQGSGELIRGFSFGVDLNARVEFTADEVGQLKYPHPFNAYYGYSKPEAVWNAIQQDTAAHELDLGMFRNGARPDYAVLVKGIGGQAELTRFMASLRNQLRESSDAGRFVGLQGDITDIKPLSWAPNVLGDRDRIADEIVTVFGVPRDKLMGRSTFANVERADQMWLRDTIQPIAILDEEFLNSWYLLQWGDEAARDCFLAYDNPVPQDVAAEQAQYSVSLGGAPWRTVNEVRALSGLPPITGGENLPVPAAMPAVDALVARVAPRPGPTFVIAGRRRKSRAALETELSALFAEQNEAVLLLVRRWGGEARRRKAGPPSAEARIVKLLAELGANETEVINTLSVHLSLDVVAGSASGFAALGEAGAWDITSPGVLSFVEEYVPKLARSLNETRAAQLEELISTGLKEGKTWTEVSWNLQESPSFSADGIAGRAQAIARTESSRAYNEGQLGTWEEAGIAGKMWVVAPDACPACLQFEGRQVPLRSVFLAKGASVTAADGTTLQNDYGDVNGPPLHTNCKCGLDAVSEVE